MSLEQKLLAKLRPHAERIEAGNNNEFDYLPAILLQVIEGQASQTKSANELVAETKRQLESGRDSFQEKLRTIETSLTSAAHDAETSSSQLKEQITDSTSHAETLSSQLKRQLESSRDSFQEKLRTIETSLTSAAHDAETSSSQLKEQITDSTSHAETLSSQLKQQIVLACQNIGKNLDEKAKIIDGQIEKIAKEINFNRRLLFCCVAIGVVTLGIGITLLVRH